MIDFHSSSTFVAANSVNCFSHEISPKTNTLGLYIPAFQPIHKIVSTKLQNQSVSHTFPVI